MSKRLYYVAAVLFLLMSCKDGKQIANESGTAVCFGELGGGVISDYVDIVRFLPLETTDTSLVGNIDQLEVVDDRIVILDSYGSNSVSAFSATDGRLLCRLSGTGNGPGEFLSPHAFFVEHSDSSLYVLDRLLSKLIRYRLSDFSYREEIPLPANSPLAFAVSSGGSRFFYYYPLRSEDLFGGRQLVEADREGKVVSSWYPGPPSGRILHGNPSAFYTCEGTQCVVPYFSDRVYEWRGDSLRVRYQLEWGNSSFPDESVFHEDDSSVIMKKIGSENYIRFLYVYENAAALAVKYYIREDLYLSAWDKHTGRCFNIKADAVTDDLYIGGCFPLPVGVSESGGLVGALLPQKMDKAKILNKDLKSVCPNVRDDDNPVLVFYTLKCRN